MTQADGLTIEQSSIGQFALMRIAYHDSVNYLILKVY